MFMDIGAGVEVVDAVAEHGADVESAATGNQTTVTGVAVDLTGLARKYNSVKVAVVGNFDLSTGRILAFKVDLQNRSTTTGAGSTWANFGTTGTTLTQSNVGTTATATGIFLHQATFEGEGIFRTAKKFIRTVLTPTDAGGDWVDDTSTGNNFRVKSTIYIFGTPDELPASG